MKNEEHVSNISLDWLVIRTGFQTAHGNLMNLLSLWNLCNRILFYETGTNRHEREKERETESRFLCCLFPLLFFCSFTCIYLKHDPIKVEIDLQRANGRKLYFSKYQLITRQRNRLETVIFFCLKFIWVIVWNQFRLKW